MRSLLPVSLTALRAFEAIGRAGGVRRAAAALGVSHAIVSRHLKTLEEQVGVALFDRDRGELTTAGAAYHVRIAQAFGEIADATASLNTERGHRLVISCAPGLAILWLTARLARFAAGRNAPIIELQALDAPPKLSDYSVDGDIRYSLDPGTERADRAERHVRTIELARPPVFPVASSDLARQFGPSLESPHDLLALPLIEEGDGTEWRIWLAAKGVTAAPANCVARYGHAHLALAAARASQGVALGNAYLIGNDRGSGELVRLRPDDPNFAAESLGSYIFRSHRSRLSDPKLMQFRRWLVREFQSFVASTGLSVRSNSVQRSSRAVMEE